MTLAVCVCMCACVPYTHMCGTVHISLKFDTQQVVNLMTPHDPLPAPSNSASSSSSAAASFTLSQMGNCFGRVVVVVARIA